MMLRIFLLTTIVAATVNADDHSLPVVPDGFVVDVVAREPVVSNPCVMAFDHRGRLFVGQGQQWRAPTPDTPGDRVDLLIDENGDGVADRRTTFADGFNSIQGLAWKGDDLWVANAPDLTVVRDTNNDDQADTYIRVYTGLGNLEHSLHGLNFAPDGKLYMSKGNSRGYNRLDQLAPAAFRELWGLPSPDGAPDYPPQEVSTREDYQRRYHTPSDDWGQSGGILRCDPVDAAGNYGRHLEIISRGFRNPWDIAFDDTFHWLGTDNDQTQGDKIFAPFAGAHFGWGHPWSYHWTGEDHLPTVPASAPLFEGSGAGVVYYHAEQFPAEYRDLFFINDWMRREVYAFRPQWNGALRTCESGFPPAFAQAGSGRTLPGSSGTVFDPTDIEVGPDGALYILSWGHAYGATIENGRQTDAGRVYRIRYEGRPLQTFDAHARRRGLPHWSIAELIHDLGSSVPAWRTNAQSELLRRIEDEIAAARTSHALHTSDGLPDSRTAATLLEQLDSDQISRNLQTWILWTLGQAATNSHSIDTRFLGWALAADADENRRIQSLRILAHRHSARSGDEASPAANAADEERAAPPEKHRQLIAAVLASDNPRIRHEMVLLLRQTAGRSYVKELLDRAAVETERVVFYSTWQALRHLADVEQRHAWLADERPGVRLAALLGLFEDDAVSVDRVLPLRSDPAPRVAELVEFWLQKTGGAAPLVTFSPAAGEFREPVMVSLTSSIPGAVLNYTTDGSVPVNTSARYRGPIRIDRDTQLKVIIATDNTQAGPVVRASYQVRHVEPFRHRPFVTNLRAPSPGDYQIDWQGLAAGKRQYTDRPYYVTAIPHSLQGLPFVRMCNNDDRCSGDRWLQMTSDSDVGVVVGIDLRVNAPLGWMKIGQPDGFADTGEELVTTDGTFRMYRREFPAGQIVLGGNTNEPLSDSGRGMYLVVLDRAVLGEPSVQPATAADVLAAMPTADAARGRELFLHPRGAGCLKCHQMEGLGRKYAPDLSDIGSRAKRAEILIQSILEPSAVITEGFAQQQIVTVDGRVFSGAVLEESGRSLTLIDTAGQPTVIAKVDIEERLGSKLSPMPDGFGKMLTAQQVADVVTWLMTQTAVGDRSGFSFHDRADHIDIFYQQQRIATYLKDHPGLPRRALVNVTTPGGVPVTRNFPPRAPEDLDPGYPREQGIIHPRMHPGIWISFGDLNGNDYWRLQSTVRFDGFVEPMTGTRDTASFAVRNQYLRKTGDAVVCTETTRYRWERVPDGLLLHIDAEYTSPEEFYFGDQEESGLAVRVASPLRVQGGNGQIINDRGERNGAQVWGKPARWFDYAGTIGGRRAGLLVVPHPKNSRPSWLHARDYGVVVTNPFPKQPKERREPYVKTVVKAGEPFQLSYAILIHDTDAATEFDRERAAAEILSRFR